MPGLAEMPELALERIARHLRFKDVNALSATCRALRAQVALMRSSAIYCTEFAELHSGRVVQSRTARGEYRLYCPVANPWDTAVHVTAVRPYLGGAWRGYNASVGAPWHRFVRQIKSGEALRFDDACTRVEHVGGVDRCTLVVDDRFRFHLRARDTDGRVAIDTIMFPGIPYRIEFEGAAWIQGQRELVPEVLRRIKTYPQHLVVAREVEEDSVMYGRPAEIVEVHVRGAPDDAVLVLDDTWRVELKYVAPDDDGTRRWRLCPNKDIRPVAVRKIEAPGAAALVLFERRCLAFLGQPWCWTSQWTVN